MKHTIGTLIASAGLILTLTACGASTSATDAAATGNVAAAQPGAAQGGRAPMDMPGVMGQISAVGDARLTVSDASQQTTTVELTDSTTIAKQQTIALSDIAVGDTVMAAGAQDGDTLTATEIRVGEMGAGPGGANPPAGGPPAGGPGGQPGAAPDGARQAGDRVMGTVASIDGDTLTVTTQDGASARVTLAADGQVTEQAEGSASDLTVGTSIIVRGDQSDSAIVATQIQIVPAMTTQP